MGTRLAVPLWEFLFTDIIMCVCMFEIRYALRTHGWMTVCACLKYVVHTRGWMTVCVHV